MLENHSTDYTVMANANAESKISGKLPRKEAFKKRQPGVIQLKDVETPVIELTARINEKDFSEALKYKIEITSLEQGINAEDILGKLSTEHKYERIAALTEAQAATAKFAEGTKVMITDVGSTENTYGLKIVKDGVLVESEEHGYFIIEKDSKLKALHYTSSYEIETITENKTIIGTNFETANIYKGTADASLEPVCTLSQVSLLDEEEDYTVCFVERVSNDVTVKVFSTETQWMSYDELAQKLNEDEVFSELFVAIATTPDVEVAKALKGEGVDKGNDFYDTAMYVPYTTTDNFARHLAQHCLYTSLKTYPTHGIMGCAKLNGVNLTTVAERVNKILELDLDLYAKKGNGNNMLNNNNVPHPIGRCLSVPFMQYSVTTGNGYNYVSNGASGYAGMVSTLAADRSSTNQPIAIGNLSFELSNYQLSKLTGKGIVTCKRTTQGLVITDGITMAPVDSAYRRLSTTKVINIVDKSLRQVIDPFIGLQDNLATKNSLNTAITSVLNKLKESLIKYYDFKIVTDPAAERLGIIKIQYTIIPTNEIKEVRNTVSVQENS